MSVQQISAFAHHHPEQAKQAAALESAYLSGEKSVEQVQKEAGKISTKILRNDVCFQLESGKELCMTERVKKLIAAQHELLASKQYLVSRHAAGSCLVCGKQFIVGDIALVECYDEGNKICLSCTNSKNTIKAGGDTMLVRF